MNRINLCVTIFVAFFIMVPYKCFAEKMGIVVDQSSIAFDVDAGESQEFVVNVKNVSDKKQEIAIRAIDYAVGDNNEITLDRDFDERDGVRDWIEADQSIVSLEPEESRDIIFVFSAPETAPVGSHRGAVAFRVIPEDVGPVVVQGQIAVHVLVNIKGDTRATGQVESFDTPLFSAGEIELKAVFANTGNIHYVPYGEVVMTNVITGTEVAHKYSKHFVFPGRSFAYVTTKKFPSALGLYRVQANFVDGEGVPQSRYDYSMGYGAPFVFVGILWVVSVLVRRVFRSMQVRANEVGGKKFRNK